MMRIKSAVLFLLGILALILAACRAAVTPLPVVETRVVTELVETTPVEVIQVVTPSPEPEGPRTLVICTGYEPFSLYINDNLTPAEIHILEAIADGGWRAYDTNSYSYQPVILEKLPSLADGDATLSVVTVNEGDKVVDAAGEVVILAPDADPPIMLEPASGGEPTSYEGGEFEMEQLTATFQLLPDLVWSDGTPLTTADSVYAFKLLANPDTKTRKTKTERTASYQALDDLTTVWTGLPGYKDGEYFTNFFGPAPEHTWGRYKAAELYSAEVSQLKPVGWGPYAIEEWIPGESLRLIKNTNYFRSDEGLPKFEQVIFRFVGENYNVSIAALLSGECDIIEQNTGPRAQIELMLELQRTNQIKASFTTGTAWEHLDFGIQHVDYDDGYQKGIDRPDFFSDVRTRQAFAYCMDRQTIVNTLLYGQSMVIDSYLPPQHPLYNPNVQHYVFDVQAGSSLLEEVGWLDEDGDPETPRVAKEVDKVPEGTLLEVDLGTISSDVRQQVADILQDSLNQCGIKTNIHNYSFPDWFAAAPEGKLFGRKFDLGEFAWGTGVKPPCDLYHSRQIAGPAGENWISIQDSKDRTFGINDWSGQNDPGFANEEYDEACDRALGSLPGQPEYEEAHKEAQRIFAEQLPVVPLYLYIKIAASRADMCGFIVDPTSTSEFWNIEEFDYGEGCEG